MATRPGLLPRLLEQRCRDAPKFTGDPGDSWCRTGDLAGEDADGYLWYQGRADDMFKAAGYRIGPSEIENCLVKHPAVANAAVVPKPDVERGAVVKAFVVLAPGRVGDAALVAALRRMCARAARPYEYPKEIEFIDSLPMTTTGKVQRRVLRLRERGSRRNIGGIGCGGAWRPTGQKVSLVVCATGRWRHWGHRVRADQGRQAQAVAQVEQSGTMTPCRCITPSTWAGALADPVRRLASGRSWEIPNPVHRKS